VVVVVFVAFYVATLDGSIFGVTHTPAAPKFELILRTSSIRSSNFLRTKFEEKKLHLCYIYFNIS
jgi:undecaprenyl pyrophosphate synthase